MPPDSTNPPFVSDAEAVAYFEAYEISHCLNGSGKYVEQVTLDETDDVDGLLERMKTLKHILKLAFDGNSASAQRVRTIAVHYPQLVHLVIEDIGHLPVAVYNELKILRHLRSLARACPVIIDPKTVDFSRHRPDPMATDKLRAIFGLVQLEWLSLENMNVAAADFAPIRKIKNLETLVISDSGLSDSQLLHIGALQKIRWLDIARTSVTDAGIQYLEGGQRLQYLCLWENAGITDACASSLLRLRNLEQLEVMDTKIGDDALRIIAKHQSIKRLDVSGTRITDGGLMAFAEMRQLESLNVEATRVTQQGVARLRQALRSCHIRSDPFECVGLDRPEL